MRMTAAAHGIVFIIASLLPFKHHFSRQARTLDRQNLGRKLNNTRSHQTLIIGVCHQNHLMV